MDPNNTVFTRKRNERRLVPFRSAPSHKVEYALTYVELKKNIYVFD